MTKLVSMLSWRDTADQAAPLAPYTIDFSQDLTWQFGLGGTYLQQRVVPRGVIVDNTANQAAVTIDAGPASVTCPAFRRITVPLDPSLSTVSFTSTLPLSVPVIFFVVPPSTPVDSPASAVLATNDVPTPTRSGSYTSYQSYTAGAVDPGFNPLYGYGLKGNANGGQFEYYYMTGISLNWQCAKQSGTTAGMLRVRVVDHDTVSGSTPTTFASTYLLLPISADIGLTPISLSGVALYGRYTCGIYLDFGTIPSNGVISVNIVGGFTNITAEQPNV